MGPTQVAAATVTGVGTVSMVATGIPYGICAQHNTCVSDRRALGWSWGISTLAAVAGLGWLIVEAFVGAGAPK